MRYSRNAILCLAFAGSCFLWGQSPTIPSVVRDPHALELLGQAVAAITAEHSTQLQDLVAEGTCTRWNGSDQSASVTFTAIRGLGAHIEVHLPDATVSRTTSSATSNYVDERGTKHPMPFKIAAQGLWYMPLPSLLDGLANISTSISLSPHITDGDADTGDDDLLVLVTAPLPGSIAVKDYADATTHIIHIDRSSHLITEIDDKAYVINDLGSSVPHSLRYSDYREESGLLLPHQIDEYIASNHIHTFLFSQFSVNTGATALAPITSR